MTLVQKSYKICIPYKRDASEGNVIKVRRFERLIGAFLKAQNYEIKDRIRDAGTEIDLLCESRMSGERILIECKAQEKPLLSDVVSKLYTDASLYDCPSAIIFATNNLGKEALGRLEKLNAKSTNLKLRFYSANDLIDFLLQTNNIVLPINTSSISISEQWVMLLLDQMRVWVATVLNAKDGHPLGHLGWNADTGTPIQPENAPDLGETDFFHADLPWLTHETSRSLPVEVDQPVIEVIPGDEWSDYRPSRPVDFVGRSALIHEMTRFFDAVRTSKTQSRLFGIKGRSGWGKSSLALKLAEELRARNIYVLPVDCRAATSSYYGDSVLSKALNYSANEFFNMPLFKPSFDYRSNPFDSPSISAYLRDVRSAGGLIVAIFDQFEAIIHRNELRSTFERLRQLALFADDHRGTLEIGFSWKTDGAVSADNPGYYMWHSLSDRRKDFEIDRFLREDADQFIKLATRGVHTNLPATVTRFILEQYSGLPWLLKKLVKHCMDEIKRAGSAVNLKSYFSASVLFEGDLQELNRSENAALIFIAREGPVELHIMEDKYGTDLLVSLIDRRLLIKSGSQISLYWDVFRDYVLDKKVPQLPNTYIPTISVRKFRSVVRLITARESATYEMLGEQLGISSTTADNAVRDLVNMGLVATDRTVGEFTSNYNNSAEVTKKVIEYLKSHVVYQRSLRIIESDRNVKISEIENECKEDFDFISIDDKTLKIYVRKIIVYCLDFGLLKREEGVFNLGPGCADILSIAPRGDVLSEDEVFRGAAPPGRVIDLIEKIRDGGCRTMVEATRLKLRNAVHASSRLGLIRNQSNNLYLNAIFDSKNVEEVVAYKAKQCEPLRTMLRDLDIKNISDHELGLYLSDSLELNWSPGSCKRYGHALKTWGAWLEDQHG